MRGCVDKPVERGSGMATLEEAVRVRFSSKVRFTHKSDNPCKRVQQQHGMSETVSSLCSYWL